MWSDFVIEGGAVDPRLEFLKYVSSLVSYNSETGEIKWLPKASSVKDANRWNARYSGKEAGTLDDHGYKRITIKSFCDRVMRIRVHQLAWFIVTGKVQKGEIDHINGDKTDNRFCNLRDVPKAINMKNRRMSAANTSGVTGVTWKKSLGKWEAFAGVDGVRIYLGLYVDIKEAEKAIKVFRKENGFTESHGDKKYEQCERPVPTMTEDRFKMHEAMCKSHTSSLDELLKRY